MNSQDVLKRLLSKKIEASTPARPSGVKKRPGRPSKRQDEKAKNLTLCLAPEFVRFLDEMQVRDPKVRGRSRKVKFIIERFLEHEKRSVGHVRVLRESLGQVSKDLDLLGSIRSKAEKSIKLKASEEEKLTRSVRQVRTLMRVLGYSPKVLRRMLPSDDMRLLEFCLAWGAKRQLVF